MNRHHILAVLAITLLPSAAAATPVYFTGTALGASVQAQLYNGATLVRDRTGFAGQIELSWTGLEADEFIAYCLTFNINLQNTEDVTIRPLSDLPNPGVNPPYAVEGAGSHIAWLLNNITPTSDMEGAALQVAIWEALYDTSYGLTGGNFRYVSGPVDVGGLAAGYLTLLGSNTSDALWLDTSNSLLGGPPQGQDYGVPVPEPASSLFLFGIGLAGLRALRSRCQ